MGENSFGTVVVSFEEVDEVIGKFPMRQDRPIQSWMTEGNAAKKSKAADIGIVLGTRKVSWSPHKHRSTYGQQNH